MDQTSDFNETSMSLNELKQMVLALPQQDFHDFVLWVNSLNQSYGDVPGETIDRLAAEIWDEDDRQVPPVHPYR